MTERAYRYTEVTRGSVEWDVVRTAERVLDAAREALGLGPTSIRWYMRSGHELPHQLTRHGRLLDVEDTRHLAGWHGPHCADCGAWIAVRADLPLTEVALTTAHECWHAHEARHDAPFDEDRAEAFARRLTSRLEESR